LIDTGNSGGISLLPSFVAAHGLQDHFRKLVAGRAVAVGGVTETIVSRAQIFTLGPTTFLEPVVLIPQGESGPSPPEQAIQNAGKELAGSIGNRILRHFVLGLDYRQRRMLLKPYDHSPVAREAGNRAGFAWGCRGGKCTVLLVAADSPAAEAGIKPGEVIMSLNGITAGPALSTLVIRRAVERPVGTVLRLSLRSTDGGERDISVMLHDY
jgi:hypothetical protein